MSIGSSSSRSVTSYESNTYDGGSLTSNGLITVEAKSADAIKGNIKAIGETITGKEVKLIASNDVSLEAAENTSKKLEDYKINGWSVGANISVNGGGILGFDASVNAAKQKGNTETTTHTATTVTGTDSVHIESGKDTNIIGSKVKGNTVTADIGGNLHIESLQETSKYIGENSSKGISVSTNGASLSNVSAENKKGTMESNYASVTDQAGIYAGEGGFNINTKGNTSLKGAVIHSDAEADKNKLSTGTLTTESIENTAEYSSRSTGIGYNHVGNFKSLSKEGKDAVWNTLGTLPTLQPDSKKSAYSTTNSAISNGTIQVREEAINLDEISRDTEHSLNTLDEIFDKKKIEERQELSQRFAKEAFGQLHNWNPTSPEGKAAKSIAHGIVAEISARIAGNKVGSGFYAGATNEALIGEINKIAKDRPYVAQWISASLGAVVNASMGNSPVTGAAVAQYGTKWNYLWEFDEDNSLEETVIGMRAKILKELELTSKPVFTDAQKVELEMPTDEFLIKFAADMSKLPAASKLLKQSVEGNGEFQYYGNDSVVADVFKESHHFKAQMEEIKQKIPKGEGTVISGFIDYNQAYNSVGATKDQHLAFGIVKTALLVKHNWDGSISYKGVIGDAYNFEWHKLNYDNNRTISANIYRLAAILINNAAVIEQGIGTIKPFGWQASIQGKVI